jgi:hypothetical protein
MMQAAFADAPATAKLPRRNPGEATLRKLLSEYSRLAAVAKQAHDVDSYRTWSAACERVSMSLLPHELPRLNAVAMAKLPPNPVEFRLNIFERARTPPQQIEAQPVNAAPVVDATQSEPEAASKSDNLSDLKPEAKPDKEEPPPPPAAPPLNNNNSYAVGSGRSLFEHPSLQPWRRYGSRH